MCITIQNTSLFVLVQGRTMCCILAVISLSFISCISAADLRPLDSCPGGLKNGESVERGRYWYICINSQVEVKGCLTDKHQRINLYESYRDNGFVLECITDNRGEGAFRYKGCVSEKNVEYAIGDDWQDDGYWYTCVKEGEKVKIEISGCVDKGRRYAVI